MPPLGILQGRLTPSHGRGIQFFPSEAGEWEAEFSKAKEAKLSSIELLVRPEGLSEHPLLSEAGRSKLKELSEKYGIDIPSVHGYTSHDARFADDLYAIVEATHALGATTVLISYFKERKLSVQADASWDRAHALLAPAAQRAAVLGIKLGVEAELSAETLLAFIQRASTPEAFGVYYDLGNQFACGFPVADELQLLKGKIVGIHVKDRLLNTDPSVESKSVFLGEGCADFHTAFKVLKEIGYAGHLILQGARGEEGKEVELATKYMRYIENIWNEL